ncbi:MAG: (5-formylfuran-3-yl)methyl phosphate synthase [Geminicoccaceae bacterium]
MLASVADLAEAKLAVAWGADFVDLKNPSMGALGAWKLDDARAAVASIGGHRPVSATIGDLPMRPDLVAEHSAAMADTGVDIVKVGFFGSGDTAGCAAALEPLAARGVRLVAVMMADQAPDLSVVPLLAAAGFYGVMLDTADKSAGGLRQHQNEQQLTAFLALARANGLLTGLAGSLGLLDIGLLSALRPDYLGFRGALCRGGRMAGLHRDAFRAVRGALDLRLAA